MFKPLDNCTDLPCQQGYAQNSHARLQYYMNQELPYVYSGFRKGRGTRDQIANICLIIEKAREFQENIYLWFTDYAKAFYAKAFDLVDQQTVENS